MTDLVPHQAQSLVTWAQEADAAYALAERMVDTAFCPATFKGRPVEAAAAVLAGAEVGLSPLAALRSFDIIGGVAAPRALTLRAIAQAAGCQFQTIEESARKVVMRAKRPGGEWETVTWTIERAQGLKLTGKDNWQKQPQAMLVARATAELARRVAADRILGLGYAAEETDEDTPTPTRRTVKRQPTPEPPPALEPPTEPVSRPTDNLDLPPPLPGEDEPPPPGGITPPQLRMMHALLNQAGISEREDRLDYCQTITGRKLATSNDLTKAEAQTILDDLVRITGPTEEPPDDEYPPLPE